MTTATLEAPTQSASTTAVAAPSKSREIRVVSDSSENDYLLDTAKFEQVYRLAKIAGAGSLIPKHLQVANNPEGTTANCFRVIIQSLRWGIDMYAAMDESYVVGGKLAYQGKLVAAVVQKHAPLVGRLRQTYAGTGLELTITIYGRFIGEDTDRTITLSVKQAKTDNSMWVKDPEQKLWYSGVIKWARRHCPDVLLGVLTDDDLDAIAAEQAKAAPLTLTAVLAPRIIESPPFDASTTADDRRPTNARAELQAAQATKAAEVAKPAAAKTEPVKPAAAKSAETTKAAEPVTKREPISPELYVRRIEAATTEGQVDGILSDLDYISINGPLTFEECQQLGEMANDRKKELA